MLQIFLLKHYYSRLNFTPFPEFQNQSNFQGSAPIKPILILQYKCLQKAYMIRNVFLRFTTTFQIVFEGYAEFRLLQIQLPFFFFFFFNLCIHSHSSLSLGSHLLPLCLNNRSPSLEVVFMLALEGKKHFYQKNGIRRWEEDRDPSSTCQPIKCRLEDKI